MVGGVLPRKELTGKPVQQQVCWILGDTHSGCWSPHSLSFSSASEGVQVPRGAGADKYKRGLFASCRFTVVSAAEGSDS